MDAGIDAFEEALAEHVRKIDNREQCPELPPKAADQEIPQRSRRNGTRHKVRFDLRACKDGCCKPDTKEETSKVELILGKGEDTDEYKVTDPVTFKDYDMDDDMRPKAYASDDEFQPVIDNEQDKWDSDVAKVKKIRLELDSDKTEDEKQRIAETIVQGNWDRDAMHEKTCQIGM